MRSLLIVGSLLLSLCVAAPGFAQIGGPPAAKPAAEPPVPKDPLDRETPRGTVLGFIHAVQNGNVERAAQYLDSRQGPRAAADLVQQLKTILDRGLKATDIDRLSTHPEGRLDDDILPNLERVGEVRTTDAAVPILLERFERRGQVAIWLFSSRTLTLVPAIESQLASPLIERYMPARWREVRVLGILLSQWALLFLAVPVILIVTWIIDRLFIRGVRPVLVRFSGAHADRQFTRTVGPLRLLLGAVALGAWASLTALPLLTRVFWTRVAVAVFLVGTAWLVFRLADIAAELAEGRLRQLNQIGRVAVVQLVRRLAKAMVVAVLVLVLLYLAGLDLTAALAGVGIGGLALAFAAQKTLENLLGGVMIISDQPVRVGDFCKVGDVMGVVEDIGLRSTRVRTLNRTVVSIPNGQMAAVNVENFGVRDKMWFQPTINIRPDTKAEHLRYVLAEIRRMLYGHPMVETHSCRVRLVRLGTTALDLEIFAYVLTSDNTTFLEVQEDLLLRIMDIVEASGTGMASGPPAMYLGRSSGLDQEKADAAIATVKRWRDSGELPFPNDRPERIAEIQNRLAYPPTDSALARRPPSDERRTTDGGKPA
jgi:MscS family membrane protein